MAFSTEPRYIPGRNQTHLRYELWSINNQCCYICEVPKEFPVMQIDHIIPQSKADKADNLYKHVMGSDFPGMHELENLGPACQPCNDAHKKGDIVFANGLLSDYLRDAIGRKPKVTAALTKRKGTKAISTAGATVLLADIADDAQRAVVRSFAESMLGTIAAAGGDLSTYEEVKALPSDLGERQSTATSLWTRETRDIESTLKLHWRQGIEKVLTYSLTESWGVVAKAVQDRFSGLPGWNGPTDAGPPNPQFVVAQITLDQYALWQDGYNVSGLVEFAAEGVINVQQPDSNGELYGDNEDFSVFANVSFDVKHSPTRDEPKFDGDVWGETIDDFGWSDTLQQ